MSALLIVDDSKLSELIVTRYVHSSLRSLMKGVQANGQIEEAELDDAVNHLFNRIACLLRMSL